MSWSPSGLGVRVGAVGRFRPSSKKCMLAVSGSASFVDLLCCLCLVFVVLSRQFVAALRSPAGLGADILALVCNV